MTTLKKILGLVLVVTIFASTMMMLSSCQKKEEKPHTHTFYTAWMNDAENHWHAPSCGHKQEKGDLGAHDDNNYDDLCDVCGYDMSSANVNTNSTTVYTVYVKDASGKAVANVKVWLVGADSYTAYKITDNKGRLTFTLGEGNWEAALAETVEGYSNTTEQRYAFDASAEATIVLQ